MDRLHNVKGRITNIFSHVEQKNPYVKYEIIYHNYLRELRKYLEKEYRRAMYQDKRTDISANMPKRPVKIC